MVLYSIHAKYGRLASNDVSILTCSVFSDDMI